MSVLDVLMHDLVGVDANGSLCSCGVRCVSWLEHLGAVALHELGAPELSPRRDRRGPTDDELWLAAQSRRENLASFRKQPVERAEPRKRVPRPIFTFEQLLVAERVEAAAAARNEEAA